MNNFGIIQGRLTKSPKGILQYFPKNKWKNEKKYLNEVLIAGFKAGSDGAFSTRLESLFAKKHRVPYAIGFNSGTTTMHAALLAMGCGRGDEVLTPALTPLMCGLAPYYTGAVPVFVDVDWKFKQNLLKDMVHALETRDACVTAVRKPAQIASPSRGFLASRLDSRS